MTAIDPAALNRFVRQAGAAREQLASAASALAPSAAASSGLLALLARHDDTEVFVETVGSEVALADEPIPWLDADTSSWTVNALRGDFAPIAAGTVTEGADVMATLGRLGELSPQGQAHILATDPEQFVANWASAGRGLLDAVGATLGFGLGGASVLSPGVDGAVEGVTGASPRREWLTAVDGVVHEVVHDPDAFARAAVRWDDLERDPYYWAGSMAPDVAAELVGAGLLSPALRMSTAPVRSAPVELFSPTPGAQTTTAWRPSSSGPHAWIGTVDEVDDVLPPDLDLQRRSEAEWDPAPPIVSNRAAPFEPPSDWVDHINPGGTGAPGRNVNCIDCTRAVESNWRGVDAVAAPIRPGWSRGTGADRLEDWIGAGLKPSSLPAIERRLQDLGPGASAMIATSWRSGRAHAFNAVNDGGSVLWVDGQLGQVAPWPPRYAHQVDATLAVFVGPDGKPR